MHPQNTQAEPAVLSRSASFLLHARRPGPNTPAQEIAIRRVPKQKTDDPFAGVDIDYLHGAVGEFVAHRRRNMRWGLAAFYCLLAGSTVLALSVL